MVRIFVTEEAFEAIKATMPLGSVGFEKEANAKGERTVWLEPLMLAKPKAMRPVCSASKARASTLPKDHRRRSSKRCCPK
jgi:hypothetical protein